MSYTYTVKVGDGVQKDFVFSFAGQDTGYLSPSNISVYVGGVLVSNYTIRISAPNTVTFDVAPPVGAEVLIRRIMPKEVPYTDFSRGNPFSQDALNNTNLQMLYLIQEIYDGYLPSGFFFRVDIDMRGHKFINLGDGVDDGDSVNMGQLTKEIVRNDTQDGRITALEDNVVAGEQANFFAQLYTATGGEVTINTTNNLFCAALYIQGLYQHKIAGAYTQVGGVITLSEPLQPGTQVYMILGTELPSDSIYATIESVTALQSVVDGINSNYAKNGANSDITSLSGLTTPLSISQGGNGNTSGRSTTAIKLDVPRGVRVNLASNSSVNFDGSEDINPGVSGVLEKTNGGTGNISGTADSLTTAREVLVNLSSNSPSLFKGDANTNPGVAGVLPIVNGGTGQADVSYVRAESTTAIPLTASAFTALTPAEVTDTKGAYTASSGVWSCPADGYYQLSGFVRFASAATGNTKAMLKFDSATAPSAGYVPGQSVGSYFPGASGLGEAILNISCTLYITAGTQLKLYAYHDHSAVLNTSHQALQIIRLR